MTVYGYGRVSTKLQDLEAQISQIEGYGVDRSYIEHEIISSRKQKREALERVLAEVSEGDTLHVVKLDRLGRDMDELGAVGRFLEEKKVKLGIGGVIHDPTTFEGRTLFLVLSMVAEIERELIAERTRDKLARKRANGEQIGRKPALTKRQRAEAAKAFEAGLSKSQIARIYGVARATVAKAILESSDEERVERDPELRKTIRAQEKEEREAIRRLEAAKRAAEKEKATTAGDSQEENADRAAAYRERMKREQEERTAVWHKRDTEKALAMDTPPALTFEQTGDIGDVFYYAEVNGDPDPTVEQISEQTGIAAEIVAEYLADEQYMDRDRWEQMRKEAADV